MYPALDARIIRFGRAGLKMSQARREKLLNPALKQHMDHFKLTKEIGKVEEISRAQTNSPNGITTTPSMMAVGAAVGTRSAHERIGAEDLGKVQQLGADVNGLWEDITQIKSKLQVDITSIKSELGEVSKRGENMEKLLQNLLNASHIGGAGGAAAARGIG